MIVVKFSEKKYVQGYSNIQFSNYFIIPLQEKYAVRRILDAIPYFKIFDTTHQSQN